MEAVEKKQSLWEMSRVLEDVYYRNTDFETGEIDDEGVQRELNAMGIDINLKRDRCVAYRNLYLNPRIEGIDVQIKDLQDRKKTLKKQKENLENTIKDSLKTSEHEGEYTIKIVAGREKVVEIDMGELADNFKKVTEEPIKSKIMDFYKKNGTAPTGVLMGYGDPSLRIK